MRVVVPAAVAAAALYAVLAGAGDLKAHLPLYLAAHAALVALMLVAWRAVARGGSGPFRLMCAAAVVFRLIAVAAPPSLSDDVYRYVWDGRVQAAGHHPYKFPPSDPARADLRDDAVYPKINHPEIPTIYPPLAEILFALLAVMKCGPAGFKLAAALLDVGVIAAVVRMLRALKLPRDRVALYAWNPLAVIETAASGHIEPLGVLGVVLAVTWMVEGKAAGAAGALAAAIQAKLLPLVLVPGFARRMRTGALLAGAAVLVLVAAPYALRGPAYGPGVAAYALRWEHGAVVFPAVRAFYAWADLAPHLKAAIASAQAAWGGADTRVWEALFRFVWPQELARVTVVLAALGWALAQSLRPGLDPARETRLALGGALLLAPTLHPWYVLWVVPFAAADLAGGWIVLAALVPLQYAAATGDVPWSLRLVIHLPAFAWMARDAARSWYDRRR